MKRKIRLLAAIGGTLFATVGFSGTGFSQQFIVDTSFCTFVTDNECVDAIPSGTTIDISELKTNKDGPVLYFWGSLTNPRKSVVAFYFSRIGDCYTENTSIPRDRVRASNNLFLSAWRYIASLTLGDLTSRIFKDAKAEISVTKTGPVDAKVTFAVADPSQNFRVFKFRNISCSGRVEARLLDSQAHPISPDASNDVKYLIITNRSRGAVGSPSASAGVR